MVTEQPDSLQRTERDHTSYVEGQVRELNDIIDRRRDEISSLRCTLEDEDFWKDAFYPHLRDWSTRLQRLGTSSEGSSFAVSRPTRCPPMRRLLPHRLSGPLNPRRLRDSWEHGARRKARAMGEANFVIRSCHIFPRQYT